MISVAKLLDRLTTEFDRDLVGINKSLHIMLPDFSFVPSHFHITEVGKVHKDFVDCGGVRRQLYHIALQAWVYDDKDHQLQGDKVANIISGALSVLSTDDCGVPDLLALPVEIEYEEGELFVSYPLTDVEITPGGILLTTGKKHTACLAPDKCGVGRCCG